jgi:hypothetical protein
MRRNSTGSFFTRLREKFFKWRLSQEIFEQMFPHLEGEKDFGYSFRTDEEMNEQTEKLNVQPVLDSIEESIRNMPKGYGECFRHVMHRDLHELFRRYERESRRRENRKEDGPRFIETHLLLASSKQQQLNR